MSHLLDEPVKKVDLSLSETQYHREIGAGVLNPETKLEYAKNLARSPFQGDIQKGLKLLEELFFSSQEICDQDCLLHLSVGFGRLKDYSAAFKYVHLLMEIEPSNSDARSLELELRRRLRREGYTGVGLVAGSILVAGLAILSYYLYSRHNR